MAADIEFNVRNGMTVGPNKVMVMNTTGELSAANITLHTGASILSAGPTGNVDLTQVIDDRSDARATDNGYLTSETTTSLSLNGQTDTLTYTDETGADTDISLAAYVGGGGDGITTIAAATDTDTSSQSKGDILVYQNSTTNKWTAKKDRASLESMYNYANASFYNEMVYTDGVLTGINVWVNSSMNTKLFERTFTYDASDNLSTIVTKDVQGASGAVRATLTKTFTYDNNNNLTAVSRVYS